MTRLAVTGHRPNVLGWGYDYGSPEWTRLKDYFKQEMRQYAAEDPEGIMVCSGMALGVDTVFFLAGKELKDQGYPVMLHAVIPFTGQESKWPIQSRELYQEMLSSADKVTTVSAPGYAAWKLQARNRALVDLLSAPCDRLYAVWNGKPSGTANCVSYAKGRATVIRADPAVFADDTKYREFLEHTGTPAIQEDIEL